MLDALNFPITSDNRSRPGLRQVLSDLGGIRGALAGVQDQAVRSGRAMRNIGGIASAALTAPIAAFGGAALQVGAEFEASMNRVAALSGATGTDLAALTATAQEMGATTQFSASQAADAMGFLAMAGFEVQEVIGAIPQTLQLAAAANMELAQTADIVSNVMSGYGMEVADLARINDVLVTTISSTNTDLRQLGEAMTYAAPIAAAAGIQFEEAAAAIGLMGNAGIQSSMAGTSLRGALANILSPTSEAADAAERLGVTLTDSAGNVRSLVEILEELAPHADDAGAFLDLFGQRAGPAMAALVGQGSQALDELTTQLETSGGTAERIAGIQMEGLRGAVLGLRSAFEGLQIAIGQSGLLEFATSATQSVTEFVRSLSTADPALLRLGAGLAAVVAAAGPLLVTLGLISIGIGSISAPVAIAVTGIAGLAAAFVALRDDSETLSAVLRGLGVVVTAFAASQIPALGVALAGLVTSFSATAAGAGVLAGALTALRTAMIFLGGPIGVVFALLGAGAASFLLFRDGAAEAEIAAYDAAAGTRALNSALGVFHSSAAPSAGAAAIALANDNYALADSAYAAAEAEVARQRALLAAELADNTSDPRAERSQNLAAERALERSLEDLTAAERALEEAQLGRMRAATAVTGSTYVMNEAMDAAGQNIAVTVDGIDDLQSSLGAAVGALNDASAGAVETGESLDVLEASLGSASGGAGRLTESLEEVAATAEEVPGAVNRLGSMIGSTFSSIIRGSESASDAVSNLLDRLADMVLSNGFNALFNSFAGPANGVFSFLFGGGFADGAAFSNGRVVPFANGGVVDSPTLFPMSSNRTGLMGEAGPEGIFPLARMPGGGLGVEAIMPAVPASSGSVVMNVSIHVDGASGDDHIRDLVQDGMEEALRISAERLPTQVAAIQDDPRARFI